MPADNRAPEEIIRELLAPLAATGKAQQIKRSASWLGMRVRQKKLRKRKQEDAWLTEDAKNAYEFLLKLRKAIKVVSAVCVQMPRPLERALAKPTDGADIGHAVQALTAIDEAAVTLIAGIEIPEKGARSKPGPKDGTFAHTIAYFAAVEYFKLTGKKPKVRRDPSPNPTPRSKTIPAGPYYCLVRDLFEKFGIEGDPVTFAGAAQRKYRKSEGQNSTKK